MLVEILYKGAGKINQIKRYFFEEGLRSSLSRKPSKRLYNRIVDSDAEATLIVLNYRKPPE
ncbi:MAG: hypothetical protein ACTXOO_00350 [Sodalis sp. (in: enterobacteria)]